MDVDPSSTLSLDLSGVTKLEDLKFEWRNIRVRWVTTALGTVRSKFLEHITIHPIVPGLIEEEVFEEWQDLDRLLVRFWTAHLIRPRVEYKEGGNNLRNHILRLLPELTARGLVDLFEVPR